MIPVAAYMMKLCNFTVKEQDQLDKGIKNILRENDMHGKQCNVERLYLIRDLGGYAETKVGVACYMTFSSTIRIKEAWKQKVNFEGNSIKKEAEEALKETNVDVEFREDEVWLERQHLKVNGKENTKTLNERKVKKL